jgi:hypothetical protein
MGERNWWEGRLLALCAKAEEGIGAGAGKDAEVLGRGEKINAGKIGAVEQEVHMAAAGRGPPGGGGEWDTERSQSSETRGRRESAYECSIFRGWQRRRSAVGRVRETHEEGWRRDSCAFCIANSREEAKGGEEGHMPKGGSSSDGKAIAVTFGIVSAEQGVGRAGGSEQAREGRGEGL